MVIRDAPGSAEYVRLTGLDEWAHSPITFVNPVSAPFLKGPVFRFLHMGE